MCRRSLVFLLAIGCGSGGHGSADASRGDGHTDGPSTDSGPDADLSCPTPGVLPALTTQELGSGLDQPLYVAQPPGSTDLYVVEKPGRIKIVRGTTTLATPFLDVTADVNIPFTGAEGGLLGLAFKSDYVTSGRFFVYMTLKATSTLPDRVAVREYHRSAGSPDVADPTPVADVISAGHTGGNNVGGTVLFGPDGYLWVAPGDYGGTPPSPAQDLTSRLGKILRVDVDNPSAPPPNGLGGAGTDPYIWDYGLRNPWRFSFDRQTHELYLADAGENMYEEVDIEAPNTGHHDFGWDRMEGKHCADGTTSCGSPGTLPAYERPHEASFSVIVGGVVYRGAAMPCLRGRYLFGIFGGGEVLSWVWNGSQVTSEMDLTAMFGNITLTNVVTFAEDQAGEVYMVMIDGHLYKLVPA